MEPLTAGFIFGAGFAVCYILDLMRLREIPIEDLYDPAQALMHDPRPTLYAARPVPAYGAILPCNECGGELQRNYVELPAGNEGR